MTKDKFEPRIIGYLCNWCSYAGADLAGVSRFQYPTNIRVIRMMCSGRLDPVVILETFIQGADGVMVGGCHIGDCHYMDGNHHAQRKIWLTHAIMDRAGFDPGRLRLEWISASEGDRFAEVVSDLTDQLTKMGPSPIKGNEPEFEVLERIRAAQRVVEDFRVRALISKEYKLTTEGNVYGEVLEEDYVKDTILEAMDAEYTRNQILIQTKEKAMSVKEIASAIDVPSPNVLNHVVRLRQKNLLTLASIDETTPRYQAMEGGM
jgi:F420-non-reducing hydrogenase iron-sulfur subunit